MTVNCWVSFFNVVLWSVNSALRVPSESVVCVCTVHISDVRSGKCSLCVHSTHFWCTVWKCSVCVHSTHFWCTVWKVFCFSAQYTFLMYRLKVFCLCAQYTFLMYRLESVLFLCTVHISDVPSGKCSVSVHNAHFWYPTMWHFFKYSTFSFSSSRFYVVCTASLLFFRGEDSSSPSRNM